jgi:hypothetical protein
MVTNITNVVLSTKINNVYTVATMVVPRLTWLLTLPFISWLPLLPKLQIFLWLPSLSSLPRLSNVQWLIWLRERARSFLFALIIFRILFLSVFNTTFLYISFNLLFICTAQMQLCNRVPLPHTLISKHNNIFCFSCYERHAIRLGAHSCEITAHASNTSIISESGYHSGQASPMLGSKRQWRYGLVCLLTRPRRCVSVPDASKRLFVL